MMSRVVSATGAGMKVTGSPMADPEGNKFCLLRR